MNSNLINTSQFQEALLQVIAKASFDFIAVLREDDRKIVFVNNAGAHLFEYKSPAEMLGLYMPSLRKERITKKYLTLLNSEVAANGFASREAEYVTKSGNIFWGKMQLNPFEINKEKFLLAQIEKIDRAKQAEEKLELEKQYFGSLMKFVSIGVIIVNDEQQIVLSNPFVLNLFGYTSEELADKKIEILIPERFRSRHNLHHARYFAHPESRAMGSNLEIYALKKDGTEFPVEISLAHFRHNGSGFTLAFINDITERKKAEEQLKANEQRIRMLIEHAPAAVAMFDTNMRYIMVSKRWMVDYRLGNRDILGRSHYEIFPEINHDLKDIHKRCLAGEVFDCREELFERADGTSDWIKWEMCPWYTAANKIGGAILFTEVITERKKAQIALQQLNKDLERKVSEKTKELTELLTKEKELGELKSRFVTMASHEFRTPLSTVLSSAFLLEKYDSTEDQPKRLKHIERIVSSVALLTDILNDFLSVGKIEEGKLVAKYSHFNVRDLVSQTIKEIDSIKKNGQQIIFHHTGKQVVMLDPFLFKHIVINLLSNAIKFSQDGCPISIDTKVQANSLFLKIKDSGAGISKEDQKHLFERFFRGSNASTIPGTGLGLHIVYKYAELMHGSVTCNSELDKGTEFIVKLKMTDE